jgi:hypothetical protein
MPIVIILLLLLTFTQPVDAIYNPTRVPNNQYGIHIADLNDISDVPTLVNSSGGDWGYVTLVSTDNDRSHDKWQTIFDQMRRTHIIPIVRIATHLEKNYWAKPNPVDFDSIVAFFNSLNWPIENRYVILYNEPNHAKEWGDTINPEEYAKDFIELGHKLKNSSNDFFLLPAGLDVSAASDNQTLDAKEYLRRMVISQPDFLTTMDGWTSHSYPNPGFSGSPYASGRGSLWSFVWELSLLQNMGLTRQLPVFITETGWVHSQGKTPQQNALSPEQVGNNLLIAANSVWIDNHVVAVTPFVFNYQDYPFDNFSWKQLGVNDFYSQYYAYQSIEKTKGTPLQNEAYVLSGPLLPLSLVANSTYTLTTKITNVGQGILNPDEYSLQIDDKKFTMVANPLPTIEPNDSGVLTVHLLTPSTTNTHKVRLYLKHNTQEITLQETDLTLIPPPTITLSLQLGWRRTGDAKRVKVIIYDKNEIVRQIDGLSLSNGNVTVPGIANIVPGQSYRIVAIVPYYLPRQKIVPLQSSNTIITMKRMLPFDINRDGKFTPADLWLLIRSPPKDYIHLFVSP